MLTSSDQVRDYWNKFSQLYGSELEEIYLQPALALSRMLKLEDKTNILEVGCGTGELTLRLLKQLPVGCKYISLDLSDEMLRLAAQKKEANKDKLNDIDHIFINEDAENIMSIKEETVDAYVASLVLHLTPNPEKLLQEAHRILKKGGVIGFTVLGKVEDSIFFNIGLNALKKNGIELPAKSSGGLSLVDRESLIKVLKGNGFEVEFCWKELVTYDIFGEQGLIKITGQPRIAKILSEVDREMRTRIEDDIKKTIFDLKAKQMPLQAEIFFITARKA